MKVIFSLNNVKESFAFCPGDVFFAMWVIGNGQFFNIGLICIKLFIAKTFSDQCKLLQVIELFKVMKNLVSDKSFFKSSLGVCVTNRCFLIQSIVIAMKLKRVWKLRLQYIFQQKKVEMSWIKIMIDTNGKFLFLFKIYLKFLFWKTKVLFIYSRNMVTKEDRKNTAKTKSLPE